MKSSEVRRRQGNYNTWLTVQAITCFVVTTTAGMSSYLTLHRASTV